MVVHLTLKNFLSLIVGACVVGLALITLLVDPQHYPETGFWEIPG
jgi:hypothetical protein